MNASVSPSVHHQSSSAPLKAEMLKLRRSQPLIIVFGLPIVIVCAGILNTLFSGQGLEDGWNTLWLRTVGFYGLFPMELGIAILASLVWRPEHRGGNWNSLMTGSITSGAIRFVASKALVVAILSTAMQVVMLVAVLCAGKVLFGLSGLPDGHLLVTGVLMALVCFPLAAFQSGMSMLLRSFAGPVAIAVVLTGISVVLLTAKLSFVSYILPHALIVRTALLGSGLFGDSGPLDGLTFGLIALASLLLTAILVVIFGRVLATRDLHA